MTIQLGILIQQTPQRTTTLCLVEGRAQCNLKERNMCKNAADDASHSSSVRKELTAVQVAGDGGMGDEEVVEVGVLLEWRYISSSTLP